MNDSDSESSDNENHHLSGTNSENSTKKRRLWTKQEDEKLRLLVSYWGDQGGRRSNWDKIAANFENRTPKNCRKRWFHSLDPKLRRGKWSKAEDKILKEAYEQMGASWQRIAQLIPGRTDDQCAKRYNDVLNPAIVDRLRPWTTEEDAKLRQLREELGPKWQQISTHLPGRTGLTIRNRYRKLTRSVRAVSEQDLDISGDVGSQSSELGADSRLANRSDAMMPLGGPPPSMENPLPFDVPGAMQGAGFPAGSDPTWLHMGHTSSYPGSYYGYPNQSYLPNNSVIESSESTQMSAQFGTPVFAQLHQNVPISGTRRQFSVTLGSQDTTPLTFLQDEHQSITSDQLEQIMEFAAKHRQQLVVHQHIYQVVGEQLDAARNSGSEEIPASVVSTTAVVRPSLPDTSSAPAMPNTPAVARTPLQPPLNHRSHVSRGPMGSMESPNQAQLGVQMNQSQTQLGPNQAQLGVQMNQNQTQVNQAQLRINQNSGPMGQDPRGQTSLPMNPNQNPSNMVRSDISTRPSPTSRHLPSASNSVESLPIETYRNALSPSSQINSPKEHGLGAIPPRPYLRQNSIPETLHTQLNRPEPPAPMDIDSDPGSLLGPLGASRLDLASQLRRPQSILPEHTPDEFLNRPLLFEEMNEGQRFDPDDLDFLAFNPS